MVTDWARIPVSHTEDSKNGTCGLSSLVLGNGWVMGASQGKASHAVLPLACSHQCSIWCESSRVTHGAE